MQSNQLTHNAFARKCSIDPSNFRKMMAGTLPITPGSLRKIADACGVRYEWLLRGEGEMVVQRQLDGVPMLDGEQVRAGALAGAGQPLLPADIIKLPELVSYTYHHRLQRIAKAAGITKHVTSHVGRHTFATWALSHGVPIEIVSKMLGHTNIETTQIYAKILAKDVDAQFERLDGLF